MNRGCYLTVWAVLGTAFAAPCPVSAASSTDHREAILLYAGMIFQASIQRVATWARSAFDGWRLTGYVVIGRCAIWVIARLRSVHWELMRTGYKGKVMY